MLCGTASAQWPVSNGVQGTITGTIGEARPTTGTPTRIHNGTDLTGTSNRVYSIQDDQIEKIMVISNNSSKNYIEMASDIQYHHVDIMPTFALNALQIQLINNKAITVPLTKGQAFATMVNPNSWPVHVHVADNTFQANFLTDGLGTTGFNFVNKVKPQYGQANNADAVEFFKDIIGKAWNAPTPFKKKVEDEGFVDKEKPLILWGPVDIVAHVYQQRINSSGEAAGGFLAPYSIGYSVTNMADKLVVDKLDNVIFDYGFSGGVSAGQDVFKQIHSKKSTSSSPHFIITNEYNSTSIEDNFTTDKHPDGDYTVTVRAVGAPSTPASATNLNADKEIKVRLDNYKTYINKVVVSDENDINKYDAEWSSLKKEDGSLIRPGDGSIILHKRNNEPFKTGTQATITVTTSEKIPSLTLSLSGGPNVTMEPDGTEGNEWTDKWKGSFTVPSSGNMKVQMTFKSGDKLYGFELNQEDADVKRDAANGRFSDKQSADRSHQLNVCPADNPMTFDVKVENGQDVTLVASGGTSPYEYSIDLMPVDKNHKSTFSSTSTFTIEFDKNYLFKVKDAGGCLAEKYYTLPKVQCDALTLAGGVGTDIKQVNLGSIAGTVNVHYEMYSVPDQITVTYRGVSQTTGVVSGSGVLSFEHTVEKGQSNLVTITMYAPHPGTAWTYKVVCPSVVARMSSPNAETTTAVLSYSHDKLTVLPMQGGENDVYHLSYRILGEAKWAEVSGVSLPYQLNYKGKELEVKVVKDVSIESGKLSVSPNPTNGTMQIQYISEKKGTVQVSVYNQQGQQLMNRSVPVEEGMNIIPWQLDEGLRGLVMLQVEQDSRSVATRLMVER